MDIPAIIEAAAATEHDHQAEYESAPARSGLALVASLAKEKGVKCSINPVAHHTDHLQFLWYGIGAARKGWLTRKEVVNTLPLGKIEAVLAAKRPSAK